MENKDSLTDEDLNSLYASGALIIKDGKRISPEEFYKATNLHPNYINNVLKEFRGQKGAFLEGVQSSADFDKWFSQSLLNLLEEVEKEMPKKLYDDPSKVDEFVIGHNYCRQQVLNILNNLKKSV